MTPSSSNRLRGHDRRAAELIEERRPVWCESISTFATEVLGFQPWEDPDGGDSQATFLDAVPYHLRPIWRSGHKVGKSKVAATIALWAYALLGDGVRVVMTAPTGRQIGEVVWREVRKMFHESRRRGFDLGGKCHRSWVKGLEGPGDRQVFGISAANTEAFSGVSAPIVVYLADEGSGIDDEIDEAIEGNSAGLAWKVSFGNPTRNEGWFKRAFTEDLESYACFHTSSERTPNVLAGRTVVPGLAGRQFIERARRVWAPHETNPRYAVRVRGDFPDADAQQVVALSSIEMACARWSRHRDSEYERAERLTVGLDVARFGDDLNVFTARRGARIITMIEWGGQDSIQVAGRALALTLAHMTHDEQAGVCRVGDPRICVDVIGIGAGVYDQLAELTANLPIDVIAVNTAMSAETPGPLDEQYGNLRTELGFLVALWLRNVGQLPPKDHSKLRAELIAARYSYDLKGRLRIEPKPDIKARLGRSPDRADSLALSLYAGDGERRTSDGKIITTTLGIHDDRF